MLRWISRVRNSLKELPEKDYRRMRLLLILEVALGVLLVAFLLLLFNIFLY